MKHNNHPHYFPTDGDGHAAEPGASPDGLPELQPVVLPILGVFELDELCELRGTTGPALLATLGIRVALVGENGTGGPDDGASGLDEDELLVIIAGVHRLRPLTGSQVLNLWRCMEATGNLRGWLAGVADNNTPAVLGACAVVAYLGDFAMSTEVFRAFQLGDQAVQEVMQKYGISHAECYLLRFEHGIGCGHSVSQARQQAVLEGGTP